MDTRTPTSVLKAEVGVWDLVMTLREAPDSEPRTVSGTATSRMLGDQWLITDVTTSSGFAGHGVFGWDRASDAFLATWVDSGGTGIAHGEGVWDDASHTMTYVMGMQQRRDMVVYHRVMRYVDADTLEYRAVVTAPDGTEYDAIQATYRRRS
jgi:hypothetical protein